MLMAKCHKCEEELQDEKIPKYSFYQKKTGKSDRLNVFIITFATLIKNKSRNRTMMKYYPHTVTSMCTMTLRG